MMPTADITLAVDLRNPGQFFACCGALELAGRLWSGSEANGWREPEGWFEGRQFHVTTYGQGNEPPIKRMINWLTTKENIAVRLKSESEYDKKIYPVELATDTPLIMDWWLQQPWSMEPSDLKFWAAHQHPLQIIEELRQGLREAVSLVEDGDYRQLFAMKTPMTTRFGFDPVAAWTPLDVGFAPNEHSHLKKTLTSPTIELFAAIGIQGFRPKPHPKVRRRYLYSTWTFPLATSSARAAVGGCVDMGGQCFGFEITRRGRFKAFSRAQEIREDER
jgi:CRISPR-associated protein Csx14